MGKTRKLKVLVLIHEGLEPPESLDSFSDDELGKALWGAEFDVINTLREMGHIVEVQSVSDELKVIRQAIEKFKPNLAFNLLEDFAGVSIFDQHVVAYLELMGMKYTGCNPRGLMLARDKALAKVILSYHRISTPQFEVFKRGKPLKISAKTEYPIFVKSLTEEASTGIAQSSVVYSEAELRERVSFIHESIQTDALAETYIDGRELYVGMLGNRALTVLPVWELKFLKAPEGMAKIATPKVKFDPRYRRKYGITTGAAYGLSDETREQIDKICRRVYRRLRLTGYARMDLRVNSEGKVFLLEANPNPHIGIDEDLAQSAIKSGMSYEALLQKILNLGLRWDPSEFA